LHFVEEGADRIMSLTGTPSVMQQMTRMPASAASRTASARRRGDEDHGGVGAGGLHGLATVSKMGRPLASLVPPLPGVTPPTMLGAVVEAALGVDGAEGAGDALADDPGVLVDENGHMSGPSFFPLW
jgi:hypothetical protein